MLPPPASLFKGRFVHTWREKALPALSCRFVASTIGSGAVVSICVRQKASARKGKQLMAFLFFIFIGLAHIKTAV
jgi:hypothetical protein